MCVLTRMCLPHNPDSQVCAQCMFQLPSYVMTIEAFSDVRVEASVKVHVLTSENPDGVEYNFQPTPSFHVMRNIFKCICGSIEGGIYIPLISKPIESIFQLPFSFMKIEEI